MRITNDKIKTLVEFKAEINRLTKEIRAIEEAIKEQGHVETKDFSVGVKEVEVDEYIVKAHVRRKIVIVEKGA